MENINKTNSYYADYNVSFIDEERESIQLRVDGYLCLAAVKDDIDTQVRVLMKKININKARIILDIVINDPNGEYVDHDVAEVMYDNEKITFLDCGV